MDRTESQGLVAYRFSSLPAERVDALVSTRIGGVSTAPQTGLNVGTRVADELADVVANREALFRAFDLPIERSVWCEQVHRTDVTVIEAGEAGRGSRNDDDVVTSTDAMVTDVVGIPLCVTLADCVPVVVYDPAHHALGLAHAGWGGTVRRLASRTLAVMGERYGTRPEDVLVGIGPSISPDDYEVGADVITLARENYGDDADRILRPRPDGKALLDLWEANAIDLERAGVPRASIEISGISTSTGLDEFYSHRFEGPTGRFACVAMLRAAPPVGW
ncbi:MAG: laccase domain-containing protein [Patulibacter sp.]|nr:laccase domain-containing protein [Patulibacter sp.]